MDISIFITYLGDNGRGDGLLDVLEERCAEPYMLCEVVLLGKMEVVRKRVFGEVPFGLGLEGAGILDCWDFWNVFDGSSNGGCVGEVDIGEVQLVLDPLVRAQHKVAHVAAAVVGVCRMDDKIGKKFLPDVSDGVPVRAGGDGIARWLVSEAGPNVWYREDVFYGRWNRC